MLSFVYNGMPARVIFGSGTIADLPSEVDRLGLSRVLVLSAPAQEADARGICDRLGKLSAGLYPHATMHTPVSRTDDALAVVRDRNIDGFVAIGGGSTTGLSKALAYRTDLPQLIIPTTYAGSEMTPILGETHEGQKHTKSSPRILPEVVIYDVDLTMTLPASVSGTSGMNAMAHAVEAMYANDRNPVINLIATDAVKTLALALPRVIDNPLDKDARADALYGAWLSGICLGSVGMALHHKLCHVLGGLFDLPHAETHAVILPHVLAYNAPAIPDAIERLKDALRTTDPAAALFDLADRLGAKTSLAEIAGSMSLDDLERAAQVASQNQYWNPRTIEVESIRSLLQNAWTGNLRTQNGS